MLVAYQIPFYLPGTLPIAFDGGGTFYLLDMRQAPVDGEYPILFASAGALDFTESPCLAASFPELIESKLGPKRPAPNAGV